MSFEKAFSQVDGVRLVLNPHTEVVGRRPRRSCPARGAGRRWFTYGRVRQHTTCTSADLGLLVVPSLST